MSLAIFGVAVALAFGVTARLTRFLNDDFLAEPLRQWVFRRFGNDSHLAYLVICSWCASIWIGIVPTAVLVWGWAGAPWYVAIAAWLGISWLYGIAAQNLDAEE